MSKELRAIRKHCLGCCGYNSDEVKLCEAKDCSLFPYRLGKSGEMSIKAKNKIKFDKWELKAYGAVIGGKGSKVPLKPQKPARGHSGPIRRAGKANVEVNT